METPLKLLLSSTVTVAIEMSIEKILDFLF